jgi:hypothetical protein
MMTHMAQTLPSLALLVVVSVSMPAMAGEPIELDQRVMVQIGLAGDSAGLARACGVEPAPIGAAIRQLLGQIGLDRRTEAAALRQYRENEAQMTRVALAIPGGLPCKSLPTLVRDAVNHLNAVADEIYLSPAHGGAKPGGNG